MAGSIILLEAEVQTKSILVIEDDSSIIEGIQRGLRDAGFDVEVARDGLTGQGLGLSRRFDLVVLDLMLPDRSGFDVLRSWEGKLAVPVIVLTARTELEDRLEAFRLGARDYVPKPFWMEELVARIRTRLDTSAPKLRVKWDDVTIDLEARQVTVGGQPVSFTRNEFDVLAYLTERPGRAVSRARLADDALPLSDERSERTVDSHIARIRKKLGNKAGSQISTVWGIGYRFEPTGGED